MSCPQRTRRALSALHAFRASRPPPHECPLCLHTYMDQDDEHFGPEKISLDLYSIGDGGLFAVRDLWTGEDLGVFEGEFATPQAVEPHAAVMVRLTPS